MKYTTGILLLGASLFFVFCNQNPTDDFLRAERPEKPPTLPGTTFKLLPAGQTGINFKPQLQESFDYNFLLDPYEYNGGGVAVLDIDNDGLQDLFFTHRFNGCRLYRNKGNFNFEDISESSGVAQFSGLKTGVAVADLNADGYPDIYVCRTWLTPLPERRNLLFINNKNNTFSEQAAAYGIDDPAASQCANFFDYDLDGDLDLYVVNHPVDFRTINNLDHQPTPAAPRAGSQPPKDAFESDKFYENKGNGRFEDVSRKAGIHNRAFGLSATTADFNDDGYPDILVANDFVMPDFLYINTGKGGFREEAHRWFAHTALHAMGCDIADLNNDAHPDICIPDMLGSTPQRQKELINTMILERTQLLEKQGYGVQQMRNVLQVFSPPRPPLGGGERRDTYSSREDLSTNSPQNTEQVRKSQSITTPQNTEQVRKSQSITAPQNTEQVRKSQSITTPQNQTRNASPPLQGGAGGGVFAELGCQAGIEATEWSWAPLIADFDNDGWKDLFITSGVYRDLNDLDFFFYTADSLQNTGGIRPDRFSSFEAFAGKMSSYPVRNFMYQNTGALPLHEVSEAWGLGQKGFSNGAAYADLDNDGDLDLIVNNLLEPASIYENRAVQTNGRNWLQIKCRGAAGNPAGIGAKIRVEAGGQVFYQEMTPIRGFYSAVEPIFQIGLGNLKTVERVSVEWPGGKIQVLDAVPANQRLWLDFANAQPGRIPRPAPPEPLFEPLPASWKPGFTHRENDFEDFSRERLLLHRFSRSGPCLAAGDLDGDGLEDLFAGGGAGQAGQIFLQKNGSGFALSAQPALDADARHEDTGALLFDADGDGDLDLYVVSGGNEEPAGAEYYQDRLYRNDGQGRFSRDAGALPKFHDSGSAVRAHDLDADGDPDLVVGGRVTPGRFPEQPRTAVLLNDGTGRFSSLPDAFPDNPGMVTDMQFADLDADGRPELILCGEWMPIRAYQFANGKFTETTAKFGLEKTDGLWNCLTVQDLDGDGDPDLLAGNEGLNTRLHATPGAPLRLFALDFDLNGQIDPVVAQAHEGRYYPLAQRNELGAQMPNLIKSKFVRYRSYARAPIEEVFELEKLRAAQKFEVRYLETCWFENKNGRFVAHPLPWQAQVSCANVALVQDFTQDGKPDILLLGNDRNNMPETGPYDASSGILLAGAGVGEWQFVPNWQHGLWAPGEARSAQVVRLTDRQVALYIGFNHAVLQGWTFAGK